MGSDPDRTSADLALASTFDDARGAVAYLVVPESAAYVAIMDVLEAAINDLSPREIQQALAGMGVQLSEATLDARLTSLRTWGAVSWHSDTSRVHRYADLLARNWKWSATPAGKRVHRFFRQHLAGTPEVREIPLTSLSRVVGLLERLVERRAERGTPAAEAGEELGELFVHHDDLDTALVGAEDALGGLVDRFDLDRDRTGELKGLLVDYAAKVAAVLEQGAGRAHRALTVLRPHFAQLAEASVHASGARHLIERGALAASRGGRESDWVALTRWFDPDVGRSAGFSQRLVRALPGMHANLRRLHTSSGMATSRARALRLARACLEPEHGTAIFLAVTGDHPWRKLHGEPDDQDFDRPPSWRGGPTVEVPDLLRSTGRAGPRGPAAAGRDGTAAREQVAARRRDRLTAHALAVAEVLSAAPGQALSGPAAQVALASLMQAARSGARGDRRVGVRDGLACTLVRRHGTSGELLSPTWRVVTPGRAMWFHRPREAPALEDGVRDDARRADVVRYPRP